MILPGNVLDKQFVAGCVMRLVPLANLKLGGANSGEDVLRKATRRALLVVMAQNYYWSRFFFSVIFPACNYNCVCCYRHWRQERWKWGRRSIHWRRDERQVRRRRACVTRRLVALAEEFQHCVPAAKPIQVRSQELLEKSIRLVYILFQMSKILVLLFIYSTLMTHVLTS